MPAHPVDGFDGTVDRGHVDAFGAQMRGPGRIDPAVVGLMTIWSVFVAPAAISLPPPDRTATTGPS